MEKAWKALTERKDEKHIRDHLQACNRKGEGVNGQLSDSIPTGNGARQGCHIEPSTITFYLDIPKLLKEGGAL